MHIFDVQSTTEVGLLIVNCTHIQLKNVFVETSTYR